MELCDGSITGRQQDRKRARGLVCSASPAALHPRLVIDDGLALFVGLNAIPKRSTLTEYTTRVDPRKLPELMHQWNRAIRACGLKAGHSFDLDFHTIPYHGHEALMEKHYVSRRSRRQNGILAFLARDAEARVFCYANAKVRKNNQNDEIVHFVEDYRTQYGKVPAELVFDSRLTTYAHLAQLDRMGIGFLTLRRRSKNLMRYRRLAQISVSHIYNLRKSKGYMSRRRTHAKTRAHKVRIGERRKPQPKGHPGYLRVDTVHQGDWDGHKGVYPINAVDQVTQFEAVVSVQQISERYLIPALQQLFDILPFEVLGFHSDNGSEYVNYRVAELLEKLRIEFTKSRARHSNDNALVECKNGHVLRKLLGHAHIPRQCAAELNEFHQRHLNRYVNYHRPCLFAQVQTDERGRQQRRYRYEDVQTPYEKLKSLPDAEQYLKVGVTFEKLDAFAVRYSDNEAADRLRAARRKLFYSIDELQRTQA